jgi:L-ribulose-5-phosphate 3-epimerase
MKPRQVLCGTTVCYPLSVAPAFTLARALEGIARVGLRAVELVAIPGYCEHLPLDCMGPGEVAALDALLRRYELAPVAINVAADLTAGPGVDYLGHALRVAADLGAATVVTHIEQTADPVREAAFLANLPRILDLAERSGAVIALETHGGLINDGVQGAALLRRLGAPALKLAYDMANVVYYGGVLPEEDLAQMGGDIGAYVGHVHLKDKANRTLREYRFPAFGEGILDFAAVLRLLDAGGYHGPMAVEVELDGAPATPEIVDAALARSLAYLDQL